MTELTFENHGSMWTIYADVESEGVVMKGWYNSITKVLLFEGEYHQDVPTVEEAIKTAESYGE